MNNKYKFTLKIVILILLCIISIAFIINYYNVNLDCSKKSNENNLNEKEQYINQLDKTNDNDKINALETSLDQENEVTEIEKVKEKKISIVFGGDILMDSYFADYIEQYGVDYSWTDISPITNKADIAFVNLETSVSERGTTKKPEGYGFRSKPYTLEGLVNAGIDFVSTANNHILDYGIDAMYDTMQYLNDYNISYAGIGSTIDEAESMTIVEKEGLKVGFISYTSILPWQNWRANDENPGVASLKDEDIERVIENIKANNDKCDVLILILHWGVEYESEPKKDQIDLAHKMIDAGADIIVGHHPHVLQGIEFYKEKPIFYSIGNFIFLKMNENAGRTGLFELEISNEGFLGGKIYPIYIQYCKANLLKENSPVRQEIIDDMISLSIKLGTDINPDGSF